MDAMRVLHCPEIIGGNPQGLARAERELGLESWVVAFRSSYLRYEVDEYLWDDRDNLFTREIKRWKLLVRALKDFDIIHFNFGSSIMPSWTPLRGTGYTKNFRSLAGQLVGRIIRCYARLFELRDLPLLKRAGKGIVVTYQGTDARQRDFCLDNFPITYFNEVDTGRFPTETDAHKRYKIATFARYADRIYALNPDLLHVLPSKAEFLPYARIDLREWQPVNKDDANLENPVLVHAPTHRRAKGTHYILEAVARLRAEGIPFEFVLVEGLPHTEARRIYHRADLLIDQLLAGWYGGLALELMALGKPAISYIREGDLQFLPEQMRSDLPIINATPTTVYSVLKEWLTIRKYELPDVGRRSRAYVEQWHDPLKTATRLEHEYQAILASKRRRG
jgi:glycosyltransferase involved in cell wall biosynthesis